MSAAFDCATLIQQASLATLGVDLGVNGFMDKDDDELAVFEYHGVADTKAHGGAVLFEHPKIQVQVRNVDSLAGWNLTYAIYKMLRAKMDVTVNGNHYQYIESHSFPHLLTRDDMNRTIYMCELWAHRSPES